MSQLCAAICQISDVQGKRNPIPCQNQAKIVQGVEQKPILSQKKLGQIN
ncbi:hypothetical protein JAMGFMIE_01763 [Rheinheimera sp. MM224]|nr:hypothetical protein JAMGFMIE_01763 [Rheinheimera sp. MM224]